MAVYVTTRPDLPPHIQYWPWEQHILIGDTATETYLFGLAHLSVRPADWRLTSVPHWCLTLPQYTAAISAGAQVLTTQAYRDKIRALLQH